MGPKNFFEANKYSCPANNNDAKCDFQVRVVNNVIVHRKCTVETCPVFYWIKNTIKAIGDGVIEVK